MVRGDKGQMIKLEGKKRMLSQIVKVVDCQASSLDSLLFAPVKPISVRSTSSSEGN